MDKFLDAYQQWPPSNQLILVVAVLLVGSTMGFVLSWWTMTFLRDVVHYLAVLVRGWPVEPGQTELVVPLRGLTDPRKEARNGAGHGVAEPGRADARGDGRHDDGRRRRVLAHRHGHDVAPELDPFVCAIGQCVTEPAPGCIACDTRSFHGGL